jgi:hypothetical protein
MPREQRSDAAMDDVFVSYARDPQPARFDLGALSGTVRIAPGKPGPGAQFDDAIERALAAVRSVIVV